MVAIVVPWWPGCPARERNWRWLRNRYEAEGWPVVEAPAPPGPWSKGAALAPAIDTTGADIVIQTDADVWTDGLAAAIEAVEGGAPWAIPHDLVHRLDEEGTDAVISGADWRGQPVDQPPYTGIRGGGIVVASKGVIQSIPVDPRFCGWGQEDECHALALTTIVGEPWRGDADLVHLWHPPQERMTRRRGSQESWNLRRRYFAARDDPAAMAALIEESRDHHSASQQAGNHHPALR